MITTDLAEFLLVALALILAGFIFGCVTVLITLRAVKNKLHLANTVVHAAVKYRNEVDISETYSKRTVQAESRAALTQALNAYEADYPEEFF